MLADSLNPVCIVAPAPPPIDAHILPVVARRPVLMLAAALLFSGCGIPASLAATPPLVVGVLLPMHGMMATLAGEELKGIEVATANAPAQLHPIRLVTQDVTVREAIPTGVESLRRAGAQVIIGTYSTQLSIPAAHATSRLGMVYWESGAVADQVTGEGLPRVFRVGASGANLGRGSATFAAEQLSPRLGKQPSQLRVAVVEEKDPYGDSVAAAAQTELSRRGIPLVDHIDYNAYRPDWDRVFAGLTQSSPDVVVLASYIPDGVSFRRQMLARNFHTGALIGSTMAECGPTFGQELGADAVGVFASDRPTRGFNPGALDAQGRAAYELLLSEYQRRWHRPPGEEALSGFNAARALFQYVLPRARAFTPEAIASAARSMDLPAGRLPNGGGLQFSSATHDLGQNLRAASVVWQWQGVRRSVTVWPAVFATGQVQMVPLTR